LGANVLRFITPFCFNSKDSNFALFKFRKRSIIKSFDEFENNFVVLKSYKTLDGLNNSTNLTTDISNDQSRKIDFGDY
jgi:hypothetical protein